MKENTLKSKIKDEMLIIEHGLKKGKSIKDMYDFMENKYHGVGRIILSEYVKKEKKKGNTKLFNQFMRTSFV